ncbi:Putative beta-1,3-glucanase, Osmotin/thaumatin-like superfamily, glucan endo-1,3-beta-glucosidase [Septoria linicola]|uniref:Beta-1,3-glucanase, Osmotin/thaumatin-like superfamily, glucan endo-1,3-beta-glucosidase n=1 Tax=Septoria linicola TaxID=215465 RepID=A0A9Q9AH15_9PEZI|nr:putative beta-1,3-glucanase, Osmotin/thaumatin-like superfamily, glucan endo-1,3-beta-glucosidase [Septoria linicola]USW49027.1 Putative beta-1,3-glucanase, Osmotin/thaumatin-like superfamily, glucan endo-1,3-beta-glucosidase [Septoria linicola]
MHTSFKALLLATACLVGQVVAAPAVSIAVRQTVDTVPVQPGGVEDIVITAENTLNATNPSPIPANDTRISIQANRRLPLALVNNIGGAVNAYVTGLDPSGRVVFVQPNGQFFYPPADASYTTPREVFGNIAIPLNAGQGSTTRLTLPDYLSSGRIWFARGNLHFYNIWAGNAPGQVQPSFANPRDPSAGTDWGFVEFTNNDGGLYANLSYVDFVGLALGMSMQPGSGPVRTVRGLRTTGVGAVCSALAAQGQRDGAPWGNLCQSGGSGPLRVVAPYPFMQSSPGSFSNYLQSHVDRVWDRYRTRTLTVDTQTGSGRVNCRVNGDFLSCDGDNRAYAKPSTADIFGCNSGPFAIQGSDNGVHRAVVPRLCAAFNRGTMLKSALQPGPAASTYYQNARNNWYSSIVHRNQPDGRGYAFSYDDVNPTGGVDQSGTLADGSPQLLSIFVGGA